MIKFFIATIIFLSNSLVYAQEFANKNSIGQTTLKFFDEERDRPVTVELWYPTPDSLKKSDKIYSPFLREHTVRDGRLPAKKFPLIIFSHGNGGNRLSLEWLAQSLVQNGNIVAAVDHWGNTFDNAIGIEFIKPWERSEER